MSSAGSIRLPAYDASVPGARRLPKHDGQGRSPHIAERLGKWVLLLGVLSLGLFQPPAAQAESLHSLISEGNAQVEAGDYEPALERYETALEMEPASSAALYNKGVALYRLERFGEAAEAFAQAAAETDDPALAARSRYNRGNSLYQQAGVEAQQDPQKALDQFGECAAQYRNALQTDASLIKAGENLELARRRIQALRELLEQQQQKQQDQQQQQNDQKNALDELIKQQQQLNEDTQQTAQQSQPDTQDLAQRQEDLRQKTMDLKEQMQQQAPPSPMDAAREHLDQAERAQEQAGKDLQRQDAQDAQPDQDEAIEALRKARDAMGGDNRQQPQEQPQQQQSGGESQPPEQKQPQDQQPPGQEEQQESGRTEQQEAEGMEEPEKPRDEQAQDILQEESENREAWRAIVPVPAAPVDKDW